MIQAKVLALKNRLLKGSGTTSGALGAIGSVHNVCHSLCTTVVSILAIFGVTLNILPLMFLQTYQSYFWWAALLFTSLSFYFYRKQTTKVGRDRNLLILNAGLLLFGLPFKQLANYTDFFRFFGGSLAMVGILLFFLGKRTRVVYRSPSAADSLPVSYPHPVTLQKLPIRRLTPESFLFAIVIVSFSLNQYLMYRTGMLGKAASLSGSSAGSATRLLSRMKLTPFDVVLAKERMDANNDGMCDVCGMPIEQCIDSGQVDCNMGNHKNTIGVLGSQHIHMDWKIYINGQTLDRTFFEPLAMDMSKPTKSTTSSFIHVDQGARLPEQTGDVLHMHATNVPLWVFFRSVGMKLDKDSLTLADGRVLKSENGKTLKFYLNGTKVDDLTNYVFQDHNKLLISFGPENDPGVEQQLASITNFSQAH